MSLMKASSAAGFIAVGDAELVGGLDRVGEVVAGIGKPQHLRAGILRLQQIAREVGGRKRHAHRADHLAAIGFDDFRGRFLQLGAERIVGGEEEPGLAALLDHGRRRAVAERRGVVGVVHRIGRAVLTGQRRAGGADREERRLLLLGDRRHRDARRRCWSRRAPWSGRRGRPIRGISARRDRACSDGPRS